MTRRLLLLWLFCSLPLSAQALRDLEDKPQSVSELLAPAETEALVLVVWCSQCGSCRGIEKTLETYAREVSPQVRVLAVTPHPADSPERIRAFLKKSGLELPVLRDPTQTLVNGLKVDRTTTSLVYDKTGRLRYLGPFQVGQIREAVGAVLSGREAEPFSRPLKGCPIPRN